MIKIIGLGKVKDSLIKSLMQEFLLRLGKYAKIEYLEKENLPEKDGFLIALDVKGKEFSSEQFADYLKKKIMEEKKITFVLGDAEGFPAEFLNHCNERISLSKMTFPHQLARVIFLEQLYRAFTIIRKEPYHK